MNLFRIFSAIFLVVIIGVAGVFLFFQANEVQYPERRTITRKDGKSLEVDILGRTGDIITFSPADSSYRYEIAIAELSGKDQWLAWVLPHRAAVPEKEEETELYVANRLKAIEAAKLKMKGISEELESGSLSWILRRERLRDLRELGEEVAELEMAIKKYRLR